MADETGRELNTINVGPLAFLDDWAYGIAKKMTFDQAEPEPALVTKVKTGIVLGGAGLGVLGLYLLFRKK